MEHTNARELHISMFPEKPALAVMDVSFISIKLVIPAVGKLLKDGADYICLIKPQFEAGKDEVGKKGVVRDKNVHLAVINSFIEFVQTSEFTMMGLDFSPIKGPEGNIEYLAWLKKGTYDAVLPNPEDIVNASHGVL